jgi:hypothetical protein
LTAAFEGFDIGSMGLAARKLGPEFNLTKPQFGLVLSGVPLGMLFGALFGSGRAPATLLLWVAAFATAIINYVFVAWMPTLMGMSGFSKTDSLLIALPFGVSGAVGRILLAWLAEHRG